MKLGSLDTPEQRYRGQAGVFCRGMENGGNFGSGGEQPFQGSAYFYS